MIEIEALAVAWALEKFHHFLYRCHFIFQTDQKPLEAILSRSLNQATPRLQHILIRTLPYNFTVRYIPGPKNLLADCLSQLGDQKDTIRLPNYMYIKFHINSQPEVTDYKNSDKPPKLTMSLHCWNTWSCQDGLAPSKKYCKLYTHTGHFVRNSL